MLLPMTKTDGLTDLSKSTGMASQGRRGAFTLIELLVVIAIIAILAAILMPVLNAAKLKAQGVEFMNNLHQLAAALPMYTDDNNGWFPMNYGTHDPGEIG